MKLIVYLCGQVENCNNASDWRNSIAVDLDNSKFTIWNPLNHPEWVKNKIEDSYLYKQELNNKKLSKNTKKCLKANKYSRKIYHTLASQCDIIIARISKEFTWGSIQELEIAINRNIPIFYWMPDGLMSVYGISHIEHKFFDEYVHYNYKDLLNKVNNIHTDPIIELDKLRWMKFHWQRINDEKC